MQFHVKGDDEKKPELNAMTRSVVVLNIEGVEQALSSARVRRMLRKLCWSLLSRVIHPLNILMNSIGRLDQM